MEDSVGKYFDGKIITSGVAVFVALAAGAYLVKTYLPASLPGAPLVKAIVADAAA